MCAHSATTLTHPGASSGGAQRSTKHMAVVENSPYPGSLEPCKGLGGYGSPGLSMPGLPGMLQPG